VDSYNVRRLRNWVVVGGLILSLALIVVFYPLLLGRGTERFGERGVAVLLLGFVGAAGLVRRHGVQSALRHGAAPAGAIPILLVATAVSGDSVFLRLVPAAVFASLADMCRISVRDGVSIIERAVQYMVPEAPEFIRDYCRNLTWLWCGFFVGCALASGFLAIGNDVDRWSQFTGSRIYVAMAGVSVIEFFVRKTWFRYYFHEGPFDRFWSRMFPAENTPRGRLSIAYIQRFRERARLPSSR
jgi:uncharacterized membrane protein